MNLSSGFLMTAINCVCKNASSFHVDQLKASNMKSHPVISTVLFRTMCYCYSITLITDSVKLYIVELEPTNIVLFRNIIPFFSSSVEFPL